MTNPAKLILVAATVGLLAGAVAAQPVPASRTISVGGHGEVNAAPDRVVLSVAVETEGVEASQVVEENARRSGMVAAALKKLLGDQDKLATTGYSVQPRYNVPKQQEANELKIVGYSASNQVVIETARIEAAGKLIDAAIVAGANRINDVRFTLADRAPHLRIALEQAGKDAQAQAEGIAKSLGVRLLRVQSATSSGPIVHYPRAEGFGMAAMRSKSDTPIEGSDVSVSADVQVVYEIE